MAPVLRHVLTKQPAYVVGPYWEPRDIWIGMYWDLGWINQSVNTSVRRLDVYVCLIPCFPIRLVYFP